MISSNTTVIESVGMSCVHNNYKVAAQLYYLQWDTFVPLSTFSTLGLDNNFI